MVLGWGEGRGTLRYQGVERIRELGITPRDFGTTTPSQTITEVFGVVEKLRRLLHALRV